MYELGYDSYKDFLNLFIPDLDNKIPAHIHTMFDNINKSIHITSSSFGATVGNSMNDILEYLRKKKYHPEYIEPYVEVAIDRTIKFLNKVDSK